MSHYIYLTIAIISEVIATTLLPMTLGFSRLAPSVCCALGYTSAFYFLALSTQQIPTAIAYSLWCGIGIILILIIGTLRGQAVNLDIILGMLLIIIGITLININIQTPH